MEVVIHEMTHILGFSNLDIPKWVTSDGTPHKNPTIKQNIRGVENLLITTPNVLKFAREYFGCPTLVGMPLDRANNDEYSNSHWKNTDLQNEYMNSLNSPNQAYFSGFTTNLLRDTGFYAQINENMEEQMFYGKGAGCEHILGKCDSTKREFCKPKTDQGLCDYYHHGYSICKVRTFNDSDCIAINNSENLINQK
ncbi:leishmanolysin family protein, putative [Ichthyophthirius multifiliis]|uniref:Leishmanolysin family protein, putative n=1 Tax=Ichthyophthirius multifiliis TaxID=5932 RepID=G0QM93_ICHMU|nr:leishmanolysin family protein, putative [Ichthyophthirius multifiliis]EGR33662.1 leishmanolysin family protein, putative [Ichthyophthirius multifiliis]|eukprot:XP_004037648.1 leishmanolysin family protein, putative [Ichthyophthirius multifiliis]